MSFADDVRAAWRDHGDHPRDVADRLVALGDRIEQPDQVAPFARLATHVLGEHLGAWAEGQSLLAELGSRPLTNDPAARDALARAVTALRRASGEADDRPALAPALRIAALADAASMLSGRGELDASLRALDDALALAAAGVPDGSAAVRALAVAGNNLAESLEGRRDRSRALTLGMVRAAEAGLAYWRRAGTWLEEERAYVRLARSHLAAGDPPSARAAIERCLEVCATHHAPPFERFFGHAVLALVRRAAGDRVGFESARDEALALYALVPAEDQRWCATELAELSG